VTAALETRLRDPKNAALRFFALDNM